MVLTVAKIDALLIFRLCVCAFWEVVVELGLCLVKYSTVNRQWTQLMQFDGDDDGLNFGGWICFDWSHPKVKNSSSSFNWHCSSRKLRFGYSSSISWWVASKWSGNEPHRLKWLPSNINQTRMAQCFSRSANTVVANLLIETSKMLIQNLL